jgi:hypothetical protein
MTDKKMFMYEGNFAGNLALMVIPYSGDAPYQFAFYSPADDTFFITSKDTNDGFILNNEYNSDGTMKMVSVPKGGKHGNNEAVVTPSLKQERIKRPVELEISDRKYIKELLKLIAVNYDEAVVDNMFTVSDNIKKHRNNELLKPEIIQAEETPLVTQSSGLITVSK